MGGLGLKRGLRFVVSVSALLIAVLAVNALRLESRQIEPVQPSRIEVDAAAAAGRLAAALKFATVSEEAGAQSDASAFAGLVDYLANTYPAVHRMLRPEKIGEGSILYVWQGSDNELEPILLLAHLDVVPVAPDEAASWTQPPFAGNVAEGFVWGRGAMDDKSSVIAILEATESLLASGYSPRRSIYIAFGHDEEVGGQNGAARIAGEMAARGVNFEWVLDEGFFVTEGLLPGAADPVALVGIAEKGIVSVALEVQAAPGHSSVPPRHTAIGILAAALVRLEERPMAASVDGVTGQMLQWLAPEMPFLQRTVFANMWLFAPLVRARMEAVPRTAATIRTAQAITMVSGGIKENVLPSQARAVVNFRIRPGDRIEDVISHVSDVVDDERVSVSILPGLHSEASPVSSTQSQAFAALHVTIRRVFPDALVAPALVVGATDARHFSALSSNVYRFLPIRLGPSDVARIHGIDERISIADLGEAIRFYRELVLETTR